ncbi:MAG: hypothetical protein A3K19_01370 [Lentisphaerae bacterium RIFOXYB12_FULL_65_16]|nr:MAG: hypothetical protein A3K18_06250 [Lentisphaerae bacterium RIFOXYA12_64_32]OGV92547.1 MAG: hypothetical protein A3K19_01370 [Lentisphaerae bacterium RIFOXYB12_FULL_65_16]
MADGDVRQKMLVEYADVAGTPASGDSVTISQFMANRSLDGGVELRRSSSSAATSSVSSSGDGAYRKGREIAQSGANAIFSARDLNIRRFVAMKVLQATDKAPKEAVLQFVQEARLTSQLEHPNIVPAHELGVDAEGNPFYTMTLVHGRTLDRILRDLRDGQSRVALNYSLVTLLTVFMKVCDAVAFAHSQGVVHRDLSPENIIVGDFGEVLVLDWGQAEIIAKPTAGVRAGPGAAGPARNPAPLRRKKGVGAAPGATASAPGNPAFMAPEQALDHADKVDPKTDIYALGGILYSILTLHPPVRAKTTKQVWARAAKGTITPPQRYNKPLKGLTLPEHEGLSAEGFTRTGVVRRAQVLVRQSDTTLRKAHLPHLPRNRIPESLAAVAMKALAFRRHDRYATVKDLQHDIEAYQQGFATAAEQAGLVKSVWLLIKRHKLQVGLVIMGLIAAVTVVACFVTWIDVEKTRAEAKEQEILGVLAQFEREERLQREMEILSASSSLLKTQELCQQGKWREALATVSQWLSLDPTSEEGWWLKGRLALALMRLGEAKDAFKTLVKLDPAGLAKQAAPYEAIAVRWLEKTKQPCLTPLEGWKCGIYDDLVALPPSPPLEFTYTGIYAFLIECHPNEWIPLLRSEREFESYRRGAGRGGEKMRFSQGVIEVPSNNFPLVPVRAKDVMLRAEVRSQGAASLLWVRASGTGHYQGSLSLKNDTCAIGKDEKKQYSHLGGRTLESPVPGFARLTLAAMGETVTLSEGETEVVRIQDSGVKDAGAVGLVCYSQDGTGAALFRNIEINVVTTPELPQAKWQPADPNEATGVTPAPRSERQPSDSDSP